METWLIYTLISTVAAGFYAFGAKMAAERNYSSSLLAIYYYFFAGIIMLVYLILFNKPPRLTFLTIILAMINSLFYFLSTMTRIKSMRYIDTVIFFPIYKVASPLFITMISLLYFSEQLTGREILGIIIGITIPLLLITKTESKRQNNLKRGMLFLLLTALFVGISSIPNKQLTISGLDIPTFMLMNTFFGLLFSTLSHKFLSSKKNKKSYNQKGIIKFSFVIAVFLLISMSSFAKAMTGNLAVVFTINSFSILIPIILSILFYGDHFNTKKGFVIILSIVSILLFI